MQKPSVIKAPEAPDLAQSCAAALARAGFPAGARLALGVSGGADSLALLLILQQLCGDQLVALTVDHGLRAAGAEEARYVAQICAAREIAHHILPWSGEKPAQNIQAQARAARYALMQHWCAAHHVGWLATAHHADDQAETLWMRLKRGTGLAGLAGARLVRPLGPSVRLVRPLLGVRRADLAAHVQAAGLQPVDDPSNADSRYTRVAARAHMAELSGLDVAGLAATAAHLAQAEAALVWVTARAAEGRLRPHPKGLALDVGDLPAELQRRLLAEAIARLSGRPVGRGPDLERLQARLLAGGSGTLQGVEVRGGPLWLARNVPPPLKKSGN